MKAVSDNQKVVALVVHSLRFGGAERQVVQIARHLCKEKFKVFIFTFSDFTPLLDESDLPRESLVVIEKRSRFDVTVFSRLARELRKRRVDIAHGFLFDSELVTRCVAKLAGVRLVIGSERNSNYKIERWRWLLLRLTLPLTDLIVANSRSGAEFHRSIYGRARQPYEVVYNGVDIHRFAPADRQKERQELGFSQNEVVVGMFASFKPQKNHAVLLNAAGRALAEGCKVRLLLVGDVLLDGHGKTDTYKSFVLDVIDQTGVEEVTTVLGNRTDVEKLYGVCDFTVLPSLHEGTPNVVLESMACGVPVIVSDVSDNSVLVEDSVVGYVVRVGDVGQLADRIVSLCTDVSLRRGMGARARETAVEKMSNIVMGKRIGEVYSDYVGSDASDD